MRTSFKFYTFLILMFVINACSERQGTTYKLYYLGGQSNMDGFGFVNDLPENLNREINDVKIFHGNTLIDDTIVDGRGIWASLRPGHGTGFSSDGVVNSYSDRFGIEMSFATTMMELDPESKIALLKYSRGGTSIDEEAARYFGSWAHDYKGGEGVNQYDHFLASVRNSSYPGDLDGDGKDDILVPSGILWMQGESDAAYTEEIANKYYENLTKLMGLIRSALGNDKIPVIVGRISDSGNNPSGKVWEYGDIVREAQHKFSIDDPDASIVISTDNYFYSDPWHYNSEGFIDLGRQFAFQLDSLMKR